MFPAITVQLEGFSTPQQVAAFYKELSRELLTTGSGFYPDISITANGVLPARKEVTP